MISDRCFRLLSRDSVLATGCLGNIIEVVSHLRKNTKCVSGEMSRNEGNLVNEKLAVRTHMDGEAVSRRKEDSCHVKRRHSQPPICSSLTDMMPSIFLSFPPYLSRSSFCKFSILTLCQVEGRGHPGVNCSACNGWKKQKAISTPFLSRVHRHCCQAL